MLHRTGMGHCTSGTELSRTEMVHCRSERPMEQSRKLRVRCRSAKVRRTIEKEHCMSEMGHCTSVQLHRKFVGTGRPGWMGWAD